VKYDTVQSSRWTETVQKKMLLPSHRSEGVLCECEKFIAEKRKDWRPIRSTRGEDEIKRGPSQQELRTGKVRTVCKVFANCLPISFNHDVIIAAQNLPNYVL
jgi:trehalose/maltose hydrolase-like predicted phosphorylase